MSVKIYQIELTNICNWQCKFCPTRHQWTDREQGFASLRLLDKVVFGDTEYVELQLSGEPGLHPLVIDFVEAIKARKILVGVATNGSIEIDYSKFDLVTVTNADGRNKTQMTGDNVVVQRLGVDYPCEDYSHKLDSRIGAGRSCTTPIDYVSVQWDGDVVPCCKCHGKQHVFGNVYDQSFEKILNGSRRHKFLNKLLTGENYICRYCSEPNPHRIHGRLLSLIKD